jgi:hypothetical protein
MQKRAGVEASGAFRSAGENPDVRSIQPHIPFVLLHHGFNSIVLKIISAIKSGLQYRPETTKK